MSLRVAIVIPALNEALQIAKVVRECLQYGDVVVVDDGSTDETGRIARDLGALVQRHDSPRGYDSALSTGFDFALKSGHDALVTLDADGQLPAADIPHFIDAIAQGADLVVGCRQSRPRLGEHFFADVCRLLAGVRDPFCGMKAYRLSQYGPETRFDTYRSIGTDLMIRTISSGGVVANVSIRVKPREDQSRLGGTLRGEYKVFRAALIGALRLVQHRLFTVGDASSCCKEMR